jgi:hypothetical protein
MIEVKVNYKYSLIELFIPKEKVFQVKACFSIQGKRRRYQ